MINPQSPSICSQLQTGILRDRPKIYIPDGGGINGGKAIILGFGINHFFDYHIDLIKYFADMLNIKPQIIVKPREIQATMRKNNEYGFLFLSNYHNECIHSKLTLQLPQENKKIEILKMVISVCQIEAQKYYH